MWLTSHLSPSSVFLRHNELLSLHVRLSLQHLS
jgi:hypothetical protein